MIGHKETGRKEMGGNETGGKEMGGRERVGKASGAQDNKEKRGKGDKLMGEMKTDNMVPSETTAEQNMTVGTDARATVK